MSLSHVCFGLDFSRGPLGIPHATNEISTRHFWSFNFQTLVFVVLFSQWRTYKRDPWIWWVDNHVYQRSAQWCTNQNLIERFGMVFNSLSAIYSSPLSLPPQPPSTLHLTYVYVCQISRFASFSLTKQYCFWRVITEKFLVMWFKFCRNICVSKKV